MGRLRPGYIEVVGERSTVKYDSYLCCHCQKICTVVPGSGKKRGFCMKCMKPTCGGPNCHRCVPFEKRLEEMESKRSIHKMLDEAM